MNIALRKLALLERSFAEKEEQNKIDKYCNKPINEDLKKNVKELMLKIRIV